MTNQLFIGVDWGRGGDALVAALYELGPEGVRLVEAPAIGEDQVKALLARTEADTVICGEREVLERMKRSGLIGGAA